LPPESAREPAPDGTASSQRITVIRPVDGEHVGYLVSAGDAWLPQNLVGFPVGEATDREAAERLAVERGLASLDGAWWCRAPKPFPTTEAELRSPEPDWPWRKVVIVEVTASTCTIRPALAWPEEASVVASLTLPVDDLLRTAPGE
jgi:hypothetical protein